MHIEQDILGGSGSVALMQPRGGMAVMQSAENNRRATTYPEQDILAGMALMQRQIEYLEAKVDEMRAILERIVLVVSPVVFTMPDGSKRPFRPNRPVSPQTLFTMARVEEISQAQRHLSTKVRTKVFLRNVEQARAEAVRKGIAIDDEREAAVGD